MKNQKLKIIVVRFITLCLVVAAAVGVYFVFRSPGKTEAAWYGDSWYYRIKLTIDHTKVAADQTDFPVYVDLSNMPGSFLSHINQTDGRDIRVTKADGITELPREVVFYNAAAKTGELYFKYTGTLSSTTDTSIYLYYGNPTASDYAVTATYGRNNVWTNSIAAAWHLEEQGNGTAGEYKDATGVNNGQGGNGVSSAVPTQTNSGQVGKAQSFDGASDWIVVPHNASLVPSSNVTVSAWVKFNQVTTQFLLRKYCATCVNAAESYGLWLDSRGRVYFDLEDSGHPTTYSYARTNDNVISAGVWYLITGVWDSGGMKIYVNGTDDTFYTSDIPSGNLVGSTDTFRIGAQSTGTTLLNGIMDEARVSSTGRSATWITTEYNNEYSPSTFFKSQGNEEKSRAAVLNFTFDEGFGTTAHDSSANGYTGTLSGTTTPSWQTEDLCVSGKCLYYNGSTAYVNVSTSVPNIQSISFWIKPKTNGETILDLDGGTHYLTASAGTITATGFSSPTIYVNGQSGGVLTANTWQHVEVTTATAFTASNITIGKHATSYLNGFIDEFKLYDYARTAAQINQDYTSRNSAAGVAARFGPDLGGTLSKGLVGYWKLDETASPSLDFSGNSYSGTWYGSATGTTGKFGNAISLNGTTDYISMGDINGFEFQTNFSVAGWIKPTNLSSVMEAVASKGCGSPAGWLFGVQGTTNVVTLFSNNATIKGSTALANNNWYFVTASVDSAGNVSIFVNGKLDNTPANLSLTTHTTASFNIGTCKDGTSNDFQGLIDEIRVYNRALSPTEVSQLYNWAPGPVGWWKLDENTGTTANDSSGYGGTGSFTGSPSWMSGKYGSSLSLNGSQYVTVTDTTNSVYDIQGDITLAAWVKTTSSAAPGVILSKDTGSSSRSYNIQMTSGQPKFFLSTSGSAACGTATGGTAKNDDQWHYIEGVRSGTAMTIYVDGVSAGTGSCTGNLFTSNTNVLIGATSGGGNGYTGQIDDVRIYNYARSASQIIEDMNAGHPAPGSPVGSQAVWYRFDEGQGTTANNAGNRGSGSNGTIANGTWTQSGKLGKALSFNGSSTIVTIPSLGSYNYASNVTVSLWVNASSLSGNRTIFSQNSVSGYYDFGIYYYAAIGKICAYGENPSTGADRACASATAATGTWYHVVGVWNGSSITLYINGVLQSSTAFTGFSTGGAANNGALYVGKLIQNSVNYYYWSGSVDDFKLYNEALTADQITQLYNQSASIVMGSVSTDASGKPDNSAARSYCVPGDTSACSSPIGVWNFDENTGVTSHDTSGNGNDASFAGSSIYYKWMPGKFGSAMYMNGTAGVNAYLSVTNATLYDFGTSTPFTLQSWVKLQHNGTDQNIIASQNNVGGTFEMYMVGSSDILRADIGGSGGSTFCTMDGTTTLADNTWHFVSVVFNRAASCTTSNILLYIDGKLETTTLTSSNVNTNTSINVGGVKFGANSNPLFGLIDQTIIYNYARTPAQIAWDYNRGAPVAWYKFDECQGTTIYNAAPTASGLAAGNNGTITIGATGTYTSVGTCGSGVSTESWNAGSTGKYGASIALDGSNDYVSLGTPSSLNTSYVSVAAWVNFTNPSDGVSNEIYNRQNSSNAGAVAIRKDTSGMYVFQLRLTGSTATIRSVSSNAAAGSGWHHVVGTYDGSTIKLYIDGILQTSRQAIAGTVDTGTLNAIEIGRNPTGINYFNGKIDDVRVYNYALTQQQVQTVMNQGSAVRFGP